MTDPDTEPEYVEPSACARLLLLALVIVAAIAAWFAFGYLQGLVPSRQASTAELDAAIAEFDALLQGLVAVSFLAALLITAYFWHFARRIRRSGRVPPPGAMVITRTRIRRGPNAVHAARLSYLLIALGWFPFIGSLAVYWVFQRVI